MDLLNDYALDPAKEKNGVWCPLNRGVEMLISRVNNEDFKKLSRAKVKSNRASLEQEDDFALDQSEEIMIEVYAHTILRDIRISDKDQLPGGVLTIGEEPFVRYTPELGIKMLKNQLFREKVRKFAEDDERYKLRNENSVVNV